ncbi:uncharacterized protein GLRG_11287 [Colletotrichum graminicola M1.001]|uniref:HNH nuclease domain-containing protein n=1 Tax=Colletotrichum graminicola (strain M1.001 / M2 / FGSC 10212) TaxID=645133 RepID=E3QZ55_COLGM|nr:uncharacterized protein GLRG_11287 [Colletotrichum graminicola M1.001]EFQ36143.1 hypothetical protein GLRG_11287 [Colletotrichum graminicola M1.001]
MFGSSAQLNAKIRRDCDYVRNFYEDEQHHHATVIDEATLKAILTEDKICDTKPNRVEYLDEYDAKRILIPEMKDLVSESHPNLLQACFWTALWSMPSRDVQDLLDELRTDKDLTCSELMNAILQIPRLVHIFRGLKTKKGDNAPPSNVATYKRSDSELKGAKIRDKFKCVITDTPKPEACHIFPFAALNYQDLTSSYLGAMLAGESNTLDTVSNMICLTPTLHDWWGRGYFALEPMGEPKRLPSEGIGGTAPTKLSTVPNTPTKSTPTSTTTPTKSTVTQKSKKTPTRQTLDRAAKRPKTNEERKENEDWVIQVRFHWLKKTNDEGMKLTSNIDFSDDPIGRLQGEGLAKAFNATTCRQVEDGQVFTFRSKNRKHLPDYDILLLQWDLLRMWRLAGGADPSIYPFHDEFDDCGLQATNSQVESLEDAPVTVSGPGTDAPPNTGEGSETAGFNLGNESGD